MVPSLTIAFDYRFDSANFFDTQAKRDLLQQAANVLASQINDTLAPIVPSGFNNWTARFPNPSTGALQSVSNLVVPANTMIIFVGGGRLAGQTEAGEGSAGGYDASGDPATWLPTVAARGQAGALASPPRDFGPWGGAIRFDNSGATSWYFGQTTAGLGLSQTDFYSVAQHEVAHILGIGTSDAWSARVSNGRFTGPNAVAAYGGQPVPVNPSGDHWAQTVRSDGAKALMDPVLVNGTRLAVTSLDLAALRDIGWQVAAPARPSVQFAAASYGVVESAGAITINVTRTGGTGPFSVSYTTADGTARAGLDYQAASGTLNFAAGEMSKTLTLNIVNDGLAEGPESFSLVLSSPTAGAALGSPIATTVTITDPVTYRPAYDFGPDGRSDPGVFRPGNATWYIINGAAGLITPAPVFGATNLFDVPVVGDFDGTGRAQVGVFRPSTAEWFALGPNGGRLLGVFGATNLFDIPAPGDYDGDGRTEMAVFRPSTAEWFVMTPSGGRLLGVFGATNLFDIPVPGDYDGDGRTEMAVFRPSTAEWYAMGTTGGRLVATFGATNLFDIPAPGDYDGLGRTQPTVFRPSTSEWFVLGSGGGRLLGTYGLSNYADLPIQTSTASLLRLGRIGGTLGGSSAPGTRGGRSAALITTTTTIDAPSPSPASSRPVAEVVDARTLIRPRRRPPEALIARIPALARSLVPTASDPRR